MRRELGMFVALVLMCLGLWYSNPDFLGESNVLNTSRQIAMLGIFTIGIGFVIITGGIDLSIGSVIGITGVIVAKINESCAGWMHFGQGWEKWDGLALGILVAMVVALLIGLAQGLLITRLQLQPFIVTLGGMLLIRGISQTIVKGGTLSFGDSPFRNFADSGIFLIDGDPLLSYPMILFLITIAIATYVLHFTVFGRYVYAIGGNRDAAQYSGINVKRVETATYVISAGLGGVAGICYAAYIGQMSQQVGIAFELYAIAAAVLGGCSLRGGEGTIIGMVIGACIMKVIDNGIIMAIIPTWLRPLFRLFGYRGDKLDNNWTFIIIGGVIVVAVVLDQLVHIAQEKRRIRRAGEIVAARQRGFDVVPANSGPGAPTAPS